MQRFTVLDSWRGVAALVVALFHLSIFVSWSFRQSELLAGAYLSVDFFFVLSGFVIAHAYGDRLKTLSDVPPFLVRRLGRIYPLHLVTLAALVLLRLVQELDEANVSEMFDAGAYSASSIVTNLLLIQSWETERFATWNIPSWSISTELFAYIVFGLLWALCAKLPKGRVALMTICAVLLLASPLVIGVFGPVWMDTTVHYGVLRCLYGFAAGVVVHEIYVRIGSAPPKPFDSPRIATVLEIAAVAVCVAMFFLAKTPIAFASPYVFGGVVLLFAYERGAVSGLLKRPSLVLLGTLSYSIYMLHYVLLVVQAAVIAWAEEAFGVTLTSLLPGAEGPTAGTSVWIGNLIAVADIAVLIVLSALSYRFIEAPGRKLGQRLADRMQGKSPASRAVSEPAAP